MAFCVNCGTEMAGAAFCPQCGTSAGAGPAAAGNSTASGMADNIACTLCYLVGLITGILFLVLEPYNRKREIRFHAWQSILLNVAWIGVWIVLSMVATLLNVFSVLLLPVFIVLPFAGLGLWLFLMWRTYNGQPVRLPFLADIADKQAGG